MKKLIIAVVSIAAVLFMIIAVGCILFCVSNGSDINLFVGNDSEYKDLVNTVNAKLATCSD